MTSKTTPEPSAVAGRVRCPQCYGYGHAPMTGDPRGDYPDVLCETCDGAGTIPALANLSTPAPDERDPMVPEDRSWLNARIAEAMNRLIAWRNAGNTGFPPDERDATIADLNLTIEAQRKVALALMEKAQERDATIAVLHDALKTAREDVEEWAGYADEYFKEKWGYADQLAAIDAVLTTTEPAARAFVERVEKPWRANAEMMASELDRLIANHESVLIEGGVLQMWRAGLRSLLNTAANTEPK